MKLISVTKMVNFGSDADIEVLLQEYEDVIQGPLPGQYQIQVDPVGKPLQMHPRKVPLKMKEEVRAELNRLEGLGVIYMYKTDQPSV